MAPPPAGTDEPRAPSPVASPVASRAALAAGAASAAAALLALALGPEDLAARVGRSDAGREAWARLLAVAPAALALVAAGLLLPALRRRPAALAACLSFPVALLMTAYHLHPEGREAGDAVHFHRMAEEWPWRPGGWWRYRVLVPWLVQELPLPTGTGYALVAALCVGASGPVLSLLLGDLGHGPAARLAGVGLHLAGFATLYNTANYCLPDPAAMLLLLLAARALARGRDAELALWLAAGAVTKEVVLFLVPAAYLWKARRAVDPAAAARAALVAAPAGALFLILRLLPGEADRFTGFVSGPAWLFPWKHQPDNLARLYSPFAAGWALVALAAVRGPSRWVRAGAGLAVPCLLSLLVTDSGRMLVYLAPFAVPAMLEAAAAPAAAPGEAAGRPGPRGWAALGLAALSMRLWEPFVVLFAVPEPLRRGAALLLAPAVVLLLRRPGPAPGGGPGEAPGA